MPYEELISPSSACLLWSVPVLTTASRAKRAEADFPQALA